jgi:hypothetical protein
VTGTAAPGPLLVSASRGKHSAFELDAAPGRLPASKRRFWSRPLAALLFFLQPVVRGRARFKCRLNLLGEVLEQDKKHFRCRIRAFWSLPAGILFGLVVVAVLSVIMLLAQQVPWVRMSLIALPLTAWWFDDERRAHTAALAALIEAAAGELALVKLESTGTATPEQR